MSEDHKRSSADIDALAAHLEGHPSLWDADKLKQAARLLRALTSAEPQEVGMREQAIEECAALMQRWADEAAEFLDHSASCRLQANLCRSAAVAIRNFARPQSK